MTQLTRPVRRATATTYRGRPLCVNLRPNHLEIWEARRRDKLVMDYASIYEIALKIRFIARQKETKAAKKRAAKKARRGR